MKLTESITTRNNLPLFTLILHKQNDKRNKNIYVYEHFGLRHMSCLGIRVKDHLHSNTCIWMVLVIFQLSSMISDTNMDQRGFFALHEEAYQKQRPYKHCLGGQIIDQQYCIDKIPFFCSKFGHFGHCFLRINCKKKWCFTIGPLLRESGQQQRISVVQIAKQQSYRKYTVVVTIS